MFYLKQNLSSIERGLRLLGAAAVALIAILWFSTGWLAITLWASAAMLAATSVVGFCPMCAMAGRKSTKKVK